MRVGGWSGSFHRVRQEKNWDVQEKMSSSHLRPGVHFVAHLFTFHFVLASLGCMYVRILYFLPLRH